ncbi:hypothetical protein JZ751_014738 [Albula glossodonta]|uniref:Musculoskeletal embryonic nuclear protein 1 n=1 Tax=Albula glossodonta TaxID=121402 RepID=A0A8T2MZL4_9TELE|nr:hypothetical protein JZ751_014738 [Albula glossodonta]
MTRHGLRGRVSGKETPLKAVWPAAGQKGVLTGEEQRSRTSSSTSEPTETMSEPDEEELKKQRPLMKEEDLKGAKDKLGLRGEVKSKTFEVMEECVSIMYQGVEGIWQCELQEAPPSGWSKNKRAGKVAPSVFSSLRSGGETALSKPPTRVIRK